MPRIRLLHWKASEAVQYFDILGSAGYEVEHDEQFLPAMMRSWRESPPDAFVIDLSRLPSHGREIAIALRQSPKTRRIPILFCEGAGEKVEQIRRLLPDATYCRLARLRSTLQKALASGPTDAVVPAGMMERYSSRTAAQKLGIQEGAAVSLIDPPRDFIKVLGELPAGVEVLDGVGEAVTPVTLCFVHELDSLRSTLFAMRRTAHKTKLWILWRKGGSAARGDVTEASIREQAAGLGLVDYKICSVNQVWSAMLFAAKTFLSLFR
jgi:CheY-like chemotaxis protein